MKNLIVLISIALLGFSACKSKKKASEKNEANSDKITENTSSTSEVSAPMAPFSKDLGGELVGKYWKIVELMGTTVEMPEGMTQEPFLKFNKDGSIKAHGGCNAIFANYELGFKNFIEISEFSQTEMECDFESFENSLVEALTYGKQYLLIGEDQMQIIVGKRAPLARLKAVYF